jgi:hypothetical protein
MAIPLQVQIPVVCFSPLMGNKQIIKTADLKSTSIGEYRLPVPGIALNFRYSATVIKKKISREKCFNKVELAFYF